MQPESGAPPSGLRVWAGHFFRPGPSPLRAVGGALLAAVIAGMLLFVLHLTLWGWNRTLGLMPRAVGDTLAAVGAVLRVAPPLPDPSLHDPTHGFVWTPPSPTATVLPPPPAAPELARPPIAEQTSPPPVSSIWRGGVNTFVRAPLRDDELPYEERPDAPLGEAVKQTDYAIIQTMHRLDMDWHAVMLISHEQRRAPAPPGVAGEAGRGGSYPYQRLRVYVQGAGAQRVERFVAMLGEMLALWHERAILRRVEPWRLSISVDGVPTHELFLSPQAGGVPPFAPPGAGTPLLTIVIDDMGANPAAAQRLLDLGVPLTFSVWPRAMFAAPVAEMAWKAGHEVLIHQPAEPRDFPAMQPGPGTVMARMNRTEIATLVTEHARRVPHAVGLNNHMGSRFTTSQTASEALAAVAAEQGLFVLDSLTHPSSVFAQAAARQGVTAYRRAVFLDDPLTPAQIRNALNEAERIALNRGQAIAIGHPHPETIDGIAAWLRTRDTRVRLVPLRALRPLY